MKIQFKRSYLLLQANALFLAACGQKAKTPVQFNIVYIMCDDLAAQAISAYGGPISQLAPTPNIDRLAKEGVTFRSAFVENSLSTPSRACLITGLYSHQNGQQQLNEGIDTTKTFFPELLQKAGYQTGVVGKWHLMCEPKGFDYYYIHNNQGEYYNPVFKSNQSHGQYLREEGYATQLTAYHAIEFLRNRDKQRPFCLLIHDKAPHRNWMPDGKYLGLYEEVQFPLPATFDDDYATRGLAAHTQQMRIDNNMELLQDLKLEEWADSATNANRASVRYGLFNELNRMSPTQLAVWEAFYRSRNKKFIDAHLSGRDLLVWKYQNYLRDYLRCVKSVDDGVGQVLDYLKRENLLDNTLVIFTSDQGFYLGEHGWFDKRFMYEESLHTPLIVRYPGAARRGIQSDALVQNIDYAPTILAAAGIPKPAQMSGQSVIPLLVQDAPVHNWRTSIYYHYYDYPAVHMVRRHDGVRTERYKLIHFYGKGGLAAATLPNQLKEGTNERTGLLQMEKGGLLKNEKDIDYYELYDLLNDPSELNNVFGKPQYQQVATDLGNLLNQYRKQLQVTDY